MASVGAARGGPPGSEHARSWSATKEAASYELGRPAYPKLAQDVLADELGLRAGTRVLDVAAGTGKLTRVLARTGADVIAGEPMYGMRVQLLESVPDIDVVAGLAESLPFRDRSVDAVTVAQAFHWFSVAEASHEFRRVLRPGGRLAVINNQRHSVGPWVEELWQTLGRYEALAPRPESTRGWREALDRTGDFGSFDRFQVANEQRFANLGEFDARFTSISFVIQLDPEDRRALLDELHKIVAGVDPLVMPLRTVIDIATRRG